MLKQIISVAKKPGLYKVISQGKNSIIVESLIDKKRIPIATHEKAISMADIAIYTMTEEEPLRNVFKAIQALENGELASIDPKSSSEQLRVYFEKVLPTYDKDRVYPNDIKKVVSWYNLLTECGINNFEAIEAEEATEEENK